MRFFSAEWMLDWPTRRANGGGVIILRSAWIAVWLAVPAVFAYELVAPPYTTSISVESLGRVALMVARWFIVVFGFTFATLTTRFASQWKYLADLYNQIKATEVAAAGNQSAVSVLTQWKAGFIEDAQVLHLVTKPIFAGVITAWAPAAKDEFIRSCGGEERLNTIVTAALEATRKQLDEERTRRR